MWGWYHRGQNLFPWHNYGRAGWRVNASDEHNATISKGKVWYCLFFKIISQTPRDKLSSAGQAGNETCRDDSRLGHHPGRLLAEREASTCETRNVDSLHGGVLLHGSQGSFLLPSEEREGKRREKKECNVFCCNDDIFKWNKPASSKISLMPLPQQEIIKKCVD